MIVQEIARAPVGGVGPRERSRAPLLQHVDHLRHVEQPAGQPMHDRLDVGDGGGHLGCGEAGAAEARARHVLAVRQDVDARAVVAEGAGQPGAVVGADTDHLGQGRRMERPLDRAAQAVVSGGCHAQHATGGQEGDLIGIGEGVAGTAEGEVDGADGKVGAAQRVLQRRLDHVGEVVAGTGRCDLEVDHVVGTRHPECRLEDQVAVSCGHAVVGVDKSVRVVELDRRRLADAPLQRVGDAIVHHRQSPGHRLPRSDQNRQ